MPGRRVAVHGVLLPGRGPRSDVARVADEVVGRQRPLPDPTAARSRLAAGVVVVGADHDAVADRRQVPAGRTEAQGAGPDGGVAVGDPPCVGVQAVLLGLLAAGLLP